jgi:hypothetical protein
METYNAKSCSTLAKLHYRPVDAALRWCGLIDNEAMILAATVGSQCPSIGTFPQWPCLRSNVEKIIDAVENGDLPYGRDGKTVTPGDNVAPGRRTIRHSDLKAWMTKFYPDQKPKFLFDEVERTTHAAYNAESFQALQAERDAAKATIEEARKWAERKVEELKILRAERDSLAAQVAAVDPIATTERNTLLKLVIGMAIKGYRHDPKASRSATTKEIADDLAALGMTISDDTVRKYLKQAADTVLPAKQRQP